MNIQCAVKFLTAHGFIAHACQVAPGRIRVRYFVSDGSEPGWKLCSMHFSEAARFVDSQPVGSDGNFG